MRNITAELMPISAVSEADAELFIEWMRDQRQKTSFDPNVIAAPRACMAKAALEDRTLALIPFQPVLMIESLARDTGATNSQLVLCLYEIQEAIKRAMKDSGHTEAYFITSDPQFADLCEARGWTKYLYDEQKKTWLMKLQLPSPTVGVTDAK